MCVEYLSSFSENILTFLFRIVSVAWNLSSNPGTLPTALASGAERGERGVCSKYHEGGSSR